jgi:hypothetical protein
MALRGLASASPSKGFVNMSGTIRFVGKYRSLTVPCSTWSFREFNLRSMCLVFSLTKAFAECGRARFDAVREKEVVQPLDSVQVELCEDACRIESCFLDEFCLASSVKKAVAWLPRVPNSVSAKGMKRMWGDSSPPPSTSRTWSSHHGGERLRVTGG